MNTHLQEVGPVLEFPKLGTRGCELLEFRSREEGGAADAAADDDLSSAFVGQYYANAQDPRRFAIGQCQDKGRGSAHIIEAGGMIQFLGDT